jgi:hypothetical protein
MLNPFSLPPQLATGLTSTPTLVPDPQTERHHRFLVDPPEAVARTARLRSTQTPRAPVGHRLGPPLSPRTRRQSRHRAPSRSGNQRPGRKLAVKLPSSRPMRTNISSPRRSGQHTPTTQSRARQGARSSTRSWPASSLRDGATSNTRPQHRQNQRSPSRSIARASASHHGQRMPTARKSRSCRAAARRASRM